MSCHAIVGFIKTHHLDYLDGVSLSSMSPPLVESQEEGGDASVKPFSCLTCRQRKVKCDRQEPCSNCLKADTPCSFVAPVRGKRKRTKPAKEGLHAKLRRYEDMLKSYGANVEPSDSEHESDDESTPNTRETASEIATPRGPLPHGGTRPTLIKKEGISRYYESTLWSNIGDEFHHPDDLASTEPADEPGTQEDELFLISVESHATKTRDLTPFYPSLSVLTKLKDVYVDTIDAIMKILHIPSFWTSLQNALNNPSRMSKSMEALMFTFCFATVSTLEEDDCQKILGGPRSTMMAQHRVLARHALVNAGFLHTCSPTTLQAFLLFIMGVKSSQRHDVQYILSGAALRLARKMGLHRDGEVLKLPPFETEMRRRLWWHVVHIDFRTAELLGARPSLDLLGDVKDPVNVFDEDLDPDMEHPPPQRAGITPISICLIRCEILNFLRSFSSQCGDDVSWNAFGSANMPIAKKESWIRDAEDRLESKYLRYCDPSVSLHTFVSIIIRSTICKLRLVAYNPRRAGKSRTNTSQSDRDVVFTNATKLLGYAGLAKNNKGLQKYMWRIGTSYLWDTVLHVLIEARHRKTGPEVDRVWTLIGDVVTQYPDAFKESTGSVYAAVCHWTVQVWDEYVVAMKERGFGEPEPPEYLEGMRLYQQVAVQSLNQTRHGDEHLAPNHEAYSAVGQPESGKDATNVADAGSFYPFNLPNLDSFEMDPDGWLQWEQLMDQGSIVQFEKV